MPMEMASGIDVAEGRSSSDLIEAMIAGRDLRAGRGAFVAVLVGAALGVEVVLPWSEPLLSSMSSLQLWCPTASG